MSVTVGGLPAEVLYAGATPGLIAGLLQVNVQLPELLRAGDSVPITISIGNATSQEGVTVAVR